MLIIVLISVVTDPPEHPIQCDTVMYKGNYCTVLFCGVWWQGNRERRNGCKETEQARGLSYETIAESTGAGLHSAHICWNISLETVVCLATAGWIPWQLEWRWFQSKYIDLYIAFIWWFVKTLLGFEVVIENQRVVFCSTDLKKNIF